MALNRFKSIISIPVVTWLKPCENEKPVSRIVVRLGPFHSSTSRWRRKLTTCAISLLTAHRLLITLFLFAAFCLLPTAFSQNQPAQPQPIPSPLPAPSPSPSPTPPPNLHQWGAVTSFHGLPSDRTHAIAQT